MTKILKNVVSLAAALACVLLSSCQSPKEQEPQAALSWPIEGVAEIRAYRVDWADKHNQEGILTTEGELRNERLPQEGVALNAKQSAKLHQVIMGEHPAHPPVDCYNPHHAFVFFDAEEKILGSVDICFMCSDYVSSHDGFARHLDYAGLRKLFTELEIPISNPEW